MAKKSDNTKAAEKDKKPNTKPKAKPYVKPVSKPKSKYAPKRTPAQKSRDRLQIIELYLEGKNYREISEIISAKRKNYSLSHSSVGDDVKYMLKEWKETREDKVELYLTIELAKIDKLEREYWEAWEKSKKDHTETATKESVTYHPKGVIERTEENKKEIIEFGDPRFLQGIERCIQKRIDLLGLEAAKTLTIKNISETTIFRVKAKELDNVEMKAV